MSQQPQLHHHNSFDAQGLVYAPTSMSTQAAHAAHMQTAMSDSSWTLNHHSPPNSTGSSTQSAHVYPLVNRPADQVDYGSPSGSTSFANSVHHYAAHQHSPPVSEQRISMNVAQMESNRVVPGRVLTRSRRRELRDESPSMQSHIPQDTSEHHHAETAYYAPDSASRPHTPNNALAERYLQQAERDGMSLSMTPNGMPGQLQSPQYPTTPASASPAYTAYGFYSASRPPSNSASNPRSASPALSVASALTSVSSGNSACGPGCSPVSCGDHGRHHYPWQPYPPEYGPPRQKNKKQRLTNIDRKEICEYALLNPNCRQEDIAAKWRIERSTVSKILKNKSKWENVPAGEDLKVAKHRPSKFPEIEALLVSWLNELKQSGSTMLLSDAVIRQKGKDIAKNIGLETDKFKASSGWVENFKTRQGIKRGVWHGGGKTLRMARAMGVGALPREENRDPAAVLSPLNPAFESSRTDGASTSMPPPPLDALDADEGLESEDDDTPDTDMSHQDDTAPDHRPPPSSSLSRHTDWHARSVDTPDAMNVSSSASTDNAAMHDSQTPYDSQPHHHDASHMHLESMTMPAHHQTDLAAQQAVSYTAPLEIYAPAPPITSSGVPDMPEVEDSINKVIAFVDSQPEGFLTWEERELLASVKNAIFQAASGVPYIREKR